MTPYSNVSSNRNTISVSIYFMISQKLYKAETSQLAVRPNDLLAVAFVIGLVCLKISRLCSAYFICCGKQYCLKIASVKQKYFASSSLNERIHEFKTMFLTARSVGECNLEGYVVDVQIHVSSFLEPCVTIYRNLRRIV